MQRFLTAVPHPSQSLRHNGSVIGFQDTLQLLGIDTEDEDDESVSDVFGHN